MSKERVQYESYLLRIRKDKGISRQALTQAANISLRTLRRYENGIRVPDVLCAIKIAEALEVEVRDIWG